MLAIATFQMFLMFVMLILAGRFERRHSQVLSMHHEAMNRERNERFQRLALAVNASWSYCSPHWLRWSSHPSVFGPLATKASLLHGPLKDVKGVERRFLHRPVAGCFDQFTVLRSCVVVRSAPVERRCILPVTLRQRGRHELLNIGFVACFLCRCPLLWSVSMVAGILQWFPEMFTFPYLPAVPHIMLVLPFVIRLMVPAAERIDPIFAEQASLLLGEGEFVAFPWFIFGGSCHHGRLLMPRLLDG